MLKSFSIFLQLALLSVLLSCSLDESPAPNSRASDVKAQLNNYWDQYEIHKTSNPDSSLHFMQKIRNVAEANNEKDWVSSAHWAIGDIYYKQGYLGDALYYYLEAAKAFESQGKLSKLAIVYNSIGDIFIISKDYKAALDYLNQAKKILHYEGAAKTKANVYQNLAICYFELKQFEETNQALGLAEKTVVLSKDFFTLSKIYNIRGVAYFKQGAYPEARKEYQLAIQCADSLSGGQRIKASALNNIGESYLSEGSYKEAEEWLMKSLAVKEQLNDPIFTQRALNTLGKLRIEQGRYDEAVQLMERGLQNIDATVADNAYGESLSLIMDALGKSSKSGKSANIAQLNQQFTTYSERMDNYNQQVLQLREQLETASKQQSVQLAMDKHQLNEKLGLSKEENEQIRLAAILIPILLSLIAAAVIYQIARRYRRSKKVLNAIEDVLNKNALRQLKKN